MAWVEVALVFSPHTLEPNGQTVTVGRSHAPEVLRYVRDALLREGAEDVIRWRNVDPLLGEMREAEAQKTAKLLAVVLPDEALMPHLQLVPEPDQ